jgi:3-hydroxyacyl-[acyl-carrier-protein] dehydratase
MLNLVIPENHPCFPGHFPGNPILPGVLLLQRVMAYAHSKYPLKNYALLNVKFLAPVVPGDAIRLDFSEVDANNIKFTVYVASDTAGMADTIACSGLLRRPND